MAGRKLNLLLAVLAGALCLMLSAAPVAANSIRSYAIDVSIVWTSNLDFARPGLLMDAGEVQVEVGGLTGSGWETASVLSFDMELGDQAWEVEDSGGYSGYSNALFHDGQFAGLDHLGVNDDGALLRILSKGMIAIDWPDFVAGYVRYRSIEAIGAAIPEPTGALLFVAGLGLATRSRRRR